MANISIPGRLSRHSNEQLNACELEFQTEVDCGFNLPSAYKSRDRQLDHLVAIASLIASVAIAAIVGFEMLWRIG